jgi:hypothetical protein
MVSSNMELFLFYIVLQIKSKQIILLIEEMLSKYSLLQIWIYICVIYC